MPISSRIVFESVTRLRLSTLALQIMPLDYRQDVNKSRTRQNLGQGLAAPVVRVANGNGQRIN